MNGWCGQAVRVSAFCFRKTDRDKKKWGKPMNFVMQASLALNRQGHGCHGMCIIRNIRGGGEELLPHTLRHLLAQKGDLHMRERVGVKAGFRLI